MTVRETTTASGHDLAALIERLEEATGPDRELDADILAVTRGLRVIDEYLFEMNGWYYSVEGDEKNPAYPSPTHSLDAAMTLVPDDYTVYLTRPNKTGTSPASQLSYACVAPPGLGGPQFAKKRAHLSSFNRSLCRALTAAALKALQAKDNQP